MKKLFIFIAIILSAKFSNSQVTSVILQASGLTCSMCSNSINKALKTIPTVAKVTPDIKNSSYEIWFKSGSEIDFDLLKKKVEGAGFAVAKLTASVQFNNKQIENDTHLTLNEGTTIHFLKVKKQTLNGQVLLHVLDKGYIPSKQFKKNESYSNKSCYKTGIAANCCTAEGVKPGSRVFHVTI